MDTAKTDMATLGRRVAEELIAERDAARADANHLREEIQALLQYVERVEAANRGHATAMTMAANGIDTPDGPRLVEAVEATRNGVLLEASVLMSAVRQLARAAAKGGET